MARADPVKVGAGCVCVLLAVFCPAEAAEVSAAVAVAAIAEIVPAGVPPEVAPVVAVPLVPAGVPADVAPVVVVPLVPLGVKETAEFVPAGVTVAFPPVVPALAFAAKVPWRNFPLSAETSVNPVGQVPEMRSTIAPLGSTEVVITALDQMPLTGHT